MNLADLTGTVLRASGQASVLIAIVLAIQWLLASRIPAAWRYALWLPVILRLLLPIAPESRFSLFNLFTRTPPPIPHYQVSVRTFTPRTSLLVLPEEPFEEIQPERLSWKPSAIQIAAGTWLAVALLLVLRSIFGNWKFGRSLARCQNIGDERVCAVFEQARGDLGVMQKLDLIEHPAIGSPALFGAFHPRLLLPAGLGQKFSDAELRHIFLHELAHIKRGDLYVNWLLVAIQAAHWFNPLVWFTCRRIRADREFACDAIALKHSQNEAPEKFGETMLKIVQLFSAFRPTVGTMSIIRARDDLKHRLQMISGYRTAHRNPTVWATLLGLLCAVGLSDAQSKAGKATEPSRPHNSFVTDRTDKSTETDLYSSVFRSSMNADSEGASDLDPGWDWLQQKNPLLTIDRIASFHHAPKRSYAYVNTELDLQNPSKVVADRTSLTHDAESDSVIVNDLLRRMLEEIPNQSGVAAISNRLATITLPQFSIPVEMPLSEVIKLLSNEVKERDPKKRGVNFLITSEGPAQPGPDVSAPIEDFKIKVSPPLRNATVFDVLEAIKKGAVDRGGMPLDRPLNYSLEPYAVVFSTSPLPSAENTLYSRTFKAPHLLYSFRSRAAVTHAKGIKSIQREMKEYFESFGIDFAISGRSGVGFEAGQVDPVTGQTFEPVVPHPPRKTLFYNDRTGVLLVRATLADLDRIAEILDETMRTVAISLSVLETRSGSQRSAITMLSEAITFSTSPFEWRTNAAANSAPVISTIVGRRDSKKLFESLSSRGGYDSITTHEATIPSGSEAKISMGGNSKSAENKDVDVSLAATAQTAHSLVLSTQFQWTDTGHLDPQGKTFSTNAVSSITQRIAVSTRIPAGDTIILSVPRVFQDGKDLLLFITPEILEP